MKSTVYLCTAQDKQTLGTNKQLKKNEYHERHHNHHLQRLQHRGRRNHPHASDKRDTGREKPGNRTTDRKACTPRLDGESGPDKEAATLPHTDGQVPPGEVSVQYQKLQPGDHHRYRQTERRADRPPTRTH